MDHDIPWAGSTELLLLVASRGGWGSRVSIVERVVKVGCCFAELEPGWGRWL